MSATDVQNLREQTGAGVMDCKKALDEAKGDFDQAKKILDEKGIAKADKKASRETGAAILEAYIHNNRVGVLLELRMETDFVGKSDPVKEFAHDLALHIAAMAPKDVENLMSQPFVKDQSKTIEETLKGVIAKVGENMKIERFERYVV